MLNWREQMWVFKKKYIYIIYNISHYVDIYDASVCTNSLIAFWWESPASTKRVIFLKLEFIFYEKPSKLATCISTTSFTFYADQARTLLAPTLRMLSICIHLSCQCMLKCDPHGTLLILCIRYSVYTCTCIIFRDITHVLAWKEADCWLYTSLCISVTSRSIVSVVYIQSVPDSANIPGILPINTQTCAA